MLTPALGDYLERIDSCHLFYFYFTGKLKSGCFSKARFILKQRQEMYKGLKISGKTNSKHLKNTLNSEETKATLVLNPSTISKTNFKGNMYLKFL